MCSISIAFGVNFPPPPQAKTTNPGQSEEQRTKEEGELTPQAWEIEHKRKKTLND